MSLADVDFPISDGGPDRVITQAELETHLERLVDVWVTSQGVERMLLVPPDHTRLHSMAGAITAWFWRRLYASVQLDVMPAIGTHMAMTRDQCRLMFGDDVPFERVIQHSWREDLAQLGELSADEVGELSKGRFREPMQIEVNKRLVDGPYDLILSVGQVVPHEVIGFANYTKNICIGVGGKDIIDKSHFLSAICGPETILGRADNPVRQAIDTVFERFVRARANIRFLLTVIQENRAGAVHRGLFAGKDSRCFRDAAALSRRANVTLLDESIKRCVTYLDPREFNSTWLGNKAVYRTRLAMADGGDLIVLAPGVKTFGEDTAIDELIRRHGYRGTEAVLQANNTDPSMRSNLSAAAHLIHGSSEDRFQITYCPDQGLTRQEIESVGYSYRTYCETAAAFNLENLDDGWNDGPDGEPFYFIRNPALGLWATRDTF